MSLQYSTRNEQYTVCTEQWALYDKQYLPCSFASRRTCLRRIAAVLCVIVALAPRHVFRAIVTQLLLILPLQAHREFLCFTGSNSERKTENWNYRAMAAV